MMPMVRSQICVTRCRVSFPARKSGRSCTNVFPDMQVDQDGLRRKNEELVQALREKTRKQLQTQELYDKLKRRAMLGQVQNAALDAVDHSIQASIIAQRFVDHNQTTNMRPPPPPLFPNQQSNGARPTGIGSRPPSIVGGQTGRSAAEENWAGFSSEGSAQRKPRPRLL